MNIEEQIKKKLRSKVLIEMEEEVKEFKTQLSYNSWLFEILVKKSESEEVTLDTYISDLRNDLLYYAMNSHVSENLEQRYPFLEEAIKKRTKRKLDKVINRILKEHD
ncbi:hypothetical protein [Dolosigranulum pigrum]|uniref:Uncharacterized protein n=1 Tax=Dolosigranulum pigrum TaxID=29394 RepID=A0A516GLL0_9LACT|nr:hypothetical protein [Dolosigranulum pigrum]QDO92175.1 hypothetical protein FNV33_09285 [Dolosigranulum pigrum]QDO92240.1 hypothetical protein FNV33_09640 [Dolosigranulum pigrum]QDO92305.1 hypothetical protein FNV33_09995 [Dolosigranulum pigrum]